MMRKRNLAKRLTAGVCFAALLFSNVCIPAVTAEEDQTTSLQTSDSLIGALEYSYVDYLEDIKSIGFSDYAGEKLVFGLDTLADAELQEIRENDGTMAVISDEEHPLVTFNITVPVDGVYQIGSKYAFDKDTGFNGSRKLLIDGESVYLESDNVAFYRKFVDANEPRKNEVGDEVKPSVTEIMEWQESDFYDNMGRYSNPLTFSLTAGTHTITLEYDKQVIGFGYITLSAPVKHVSYEEYIRGASQSVTDFDVRFQAEDIMAYRNASAIGMASDGDPKVTPIDPGYLVMNTAGGYSFREGGQSITFEVNVEEAGYYHINFRSKQTWNTKRNSYRKIEINGEVPFQEAECVSFPYSNHWQNIIPGNEEGEPYLFYLNAGKNEITLTVVLGPNTQTVRVLETALNKLSTLVRKITMIIGNDPDPNYDYELERTVPGLTETLQEVADLVEQARADCNAQNGGKDTPTGNTLESNMKMLLEMKEEPKRISRRSSDLSNIVTSLGDAVTTLQSQAVQLDYIEVFSPDLEIKDYHANFFDVLVTTVKGFLVSFEKDYTSVSAADSEGKVLDVWVGRGKEWAEIMKELVDSDFTPKTGVQLNLNVVPSGSLTSSGSVNLLLLSITAGTEPDLAMGVADITAVEYAIRNVVVDLSKMDGYEDVISRFPEGIMVPFGYEGGIYGVPESMTFRGMFYRTDIVEELGLKLPETWDEVFNDLVPALNENGMQFYLPNWMDTFVLSNGGTYYKTDENGHVQSALDSPEAYEGFKLLTDAYVVQGLPTVANFLNRFRTGEMPIGLGTNGMYLQLISAAPELNGKWSMAPIPGMVQDDGSVVRKFNGIVSTGLSVLSSSQNVNEAWAFIDWWTSDETQITYSREVESRIGTSARWISSNIEAFKSLPWETEVLNTVEDVWKNICEIPNVLGGYLTSRHVGNAWNRVVINGMLPRESLEQTVRDINRELDRKRDQMFGGN